MKQPRSVALGEIAQAIDYGVTASASREAVGPKFLRITDIQDGAVDWRAVPWCECGARAADDARLERGDIVFARTGATTGKSYLIGECPVNAVFASYLIRVRLGAEAEPRYVAHFFQTVDYWTQISQSVRGVAQPGVNATTLRGLQVPLPDLADQRRIADVLDRAEALRAKRRAALAEVETLTQAIFLEMFGAVPSSGLQTVADVAAPIKNACVGGPFGSDLTQADYVEDAGVPVVRGYNLSTAEPWIREDDFVYVSESKAATLEANIAKRGDVLFSQRGARLAGQVAYVHAGSRFEKYLVSQSQMKVTPDLSKVEPVFLVHYFRTERAIQMMERRQISTGVPHINLGILRRFPVPVPPLAEQREFARRAAAVESLAKAQRASLTEMDALFASLQHRAFRGEL